MSSYLGMEVPTSSQGFVQLGSCQLPTCLPSCQDSTECSWCLGLEDRRWGVASNQWDQKICYSRSERVKKMIHTSSSLPLIASIDCKLQIMIEFSHHFWYSNSSDAKSRTNESWRIKAGIKRPTVPRDVWHILTLHMVYHDGSWWTLYNWCPLWSKQISKGGKRLCSSTCSWSTQGPEFEAF